MALEDNIDKVAFTTLHPQDKVFWTHEGSGEVTAAPGSVSVEIANPISEKFFIKMLYSDDNTNWYDAGFSPFYAAFGTYVARITGTWEMTDSTITVLMTSLDAARTMYFKLVGFYDE